MKLTAKLLYLLILLSSCDCKQDVYGTVIDADTLLPIDSVFAFKQNKENDFGYTDAQGHFEINSIDGGLSIGCPPMTVLFKKVGYEMDSTKIEVGHHAKIRLQKSIH